MPRITRKTAIAWDGNLARGRGHISAATGAFAELAFSLATRIAPKEGATSPEELLAGAHGACFTMSLAGELTAAGTPPTQIEVSCEIVMDEVEGAGHQIVGSNLEARAVVEGIDEAAFAEVARRADEECPFSALLKRSGAQVTLDGRLVS
jgi:osmotically inducible protein OsmC